MDQDTLVAYDNNAAAFAADWQAQPDPVDLQSAVREFFTPGLTADIGCGSGRDAAWLARNGFGVIGYDGSLGLLAEARRLHPGIEFRRALLPDLAVIADETFVNVLCETVIMHLEPAQIPPAVRRLVAILKPAGTLYLTWRVSKEGNSRDKFDRLYAAFDSGLVLDALRTAATLLLNEEVDSASSGKLIRRVVARKST